MNTLAMPTVEKYLAVILGSATFATKAWELNLYLRVHFWFCTRP